MSIFSLAVYVPDSYILLTNVIRLIVYKKEEINVQKKRDTMFASHNSGTDHASGNGGTKYNQESGDPSFEAVGRRIELLQEEIQRTARIAPCYQPNSSHFSENQEEEAPCVPTTDSLQARKDNLAASVQELSETINDENHVCFDSIGYSILLIFSLHGAGERRHTLRNTCRDSLIGSLFRHIVKV